MSRLIDLTDEKFGMLTVVSIAHTKLYEGQTVPYWNCLCECGNFSVVAGRSLRNSSTKSCGCFHKEHLGNRTRVHGMRHTPTYGTWRSMKERCGNPKNKYYYLYGGAGIQVCKRWGFFNSFLEDMGIRPEDKTLDRIDPYGNYCKENCRWATDIEQANNKRKKND